MKRSCFFLVTVLFFFGCSTVIKPRSQTVIPPHTLLFTFDDGPNVRFHVTERVLDVLKRHRIRAYFSLIGFRAVENPELVRRIHREGHVIVNHTMHHDPSIIGGKEQVTREFDEADAVFGRILGITNYRSRFVRTPLGVITGNIAEVMKERGTFILPVTYFNGDSEATSNDHDRVIDEMIREFDRNDGGMILFHDGIPRFHQLQDWEFTDPNSPANRDWIPAALEKTIGYFGAKGYRFGLDEAGESNITVNGFLAKEK